jgi:hypothetical protein
MQPVFEVVPLVDGPWMASFSPSVNADNDGCQVPSTIQRASSSSSTAAGSTALRLMWIITLLDIIIQYYRLGLVGFAARQVFDDIAGGTLLNNGDELKTSVEAERLLVHLLVLTIAIGWPFVKQILEKASTKNKINKNKNKNSKMVHHHHSLSSPPPTDHDMYSNVNAWLVQWLVVHALIVLAWLLLFFGDHMTAFFMDSTLDANSTIWVHVFTVIMYISWVIAVISVRCMTGRRSRKNGKNDNINDRNDDEAADDAKKSCWSRLCRTKESEESSSSTSLTDAADTVSSHHRQYYKILIV